MIWVELGLEPDGFWRSTPRLLSMIAEGKRRASETAHQERMTLAWNTAALHRAKRMPALKDVLAKKKREPRRKALGPDQLLTMARMWSAIAGPEAKG